MPLYQVLKNLKGRSKDISFYYGENDWMLDESSRKLISQRDFSFNYDIIEQCGHQIPF